MTNFKPTSRWIVPSILLMVGCQAIDRRETQVDPLEQLHKTVSYRDVDEANADSTNKSLSRATPYLASPTQRATQLGRSARDGLRFMGRSTVSGVRHMGEAVFGGLGEAMIDVLFGAISGAIFDGIFGDDEDDVDDYDSPRATDDRNFQSWIDQREEYGKK